MKRRAMIALLAAFTVLFCGCSRNGGAAAATTAAETTAATTTSAETTTAETTTTEAEITEKQALTLPDERLFGGYIKSDDPSNLLREADENAEVIRVIPGWTQLDIFDGGKDGWYMTRIAKEDGSGYDIGYIRSDNITEIPAFDMDSVEPGSVITLAQLSGTWVLEGDPDSTLWILAEMDPYSGIFIHTMADSTVTRGRITLTDFEYPDGTPGHCYNFNTLDGEAWEALEVSSTSDMTSDFYFGQMGDKHYFRALSGNAGEAPDEKTAAEKMNALSIIMGSFAGVHNIILSDSPDAVNTDQKAKIADPRLTSFDDIISNINYICAPELAKNLTELAKTRFIKKDGSLDITGYPVFRLESGLTISDLTDTSFTATTVAGDEMNGYGRAYFVKSGNIWVISSYEFGSF